jgi:hypothetical protein
MRRLLPLTAAIALALTAACSHDDGSSADRDRDRDDRRSGDEATTTEPGDLDPAVYAPAIRDTFVASCHQGGVAEDHCRCAIDKIAATLPLDAFVAYEQAVLADPSTDPPRQVTAALHACAG